MLVRGSFGLSPASSPLAVAVSPFPALSSAEEPQKIFVSFAASSSDPAGCHHVPEPKVKTKPRGTSTHPALRSTAGLPLLCSPGLCHIPASADAQMPVGDLLLPDRRGQRGTGGSRGTEPGYQRGQAALISSVTVNSVSSVMRDAKDVSSRDEHPRA